MMKTKVLYAAVLFPVITACGDSTAPRAGGNVAVRFSAGAPAGATLSTGLASARPLLDHMPAGNALTISGSNGTLVLQDIRLIVSEIELKRANAVCASDVDSDECEEFEGGPFLVNLLDGSASETVNASIAAGSYSEFKFEAEDFDLDEGDDAAERTALQALLAQMRQTYTSFPSGASMVVHGTFTPTGGAARPFTVYFAAEVEVEQEFATPFRVPEDGAIEVNLDPGAWFRSGTEVTDLSALDGRTIEFELEFERGVSVDRDDD